MIDPDPVQRMADHLAHPADMAWHHKQRWIERLAELRRAVRDASDGEARARAKQAMLNHYTVQTDVEPTRIAMMCAAAAGLPNPPSSEELNRIAREAIEIWRARQGNAAEA